LNVRRHEKSLTATGGTSMLNQFFPQRLDNVYRGHKLALWFFALIVLMKAGISLGSIFSGYVTASSADGIPLDTFTPAGAQTVISLFALLGLAQLMICLLCILVLIRYRIMIPFMLALLLMEYLSRKLILQILPIPGTGTPPGSAMNLVILAVMIVGLALSLWNQDKPQTRK